MRKAWFLLIAGLLTLTVGSLSNIALADEYILIMSKNDKLCQHMHNLYNDDLRKYGNIRYEEHEEFNQIKWKEGSKFFYYHGKKETGSWNISQFDINGDGKKEIVVKDDSFFVGTPTQHLFIFKNEDLNLFENEFDLSNIDKAIGRVGSGEQFRSKIYPLKWLPPISVQIGGRTEKAFPSIAGHFYLKPFVYENKFNIEMSDNSFGSSEEVGYLSITKLNKDNQLEDECYFLYFPTCKNNDDEER